MPFVCKSLVRRSIAISNKSAAVFPFPVYDKCKNGFIQKERAAAELREPDGRTDGRTDVRRNGIKAALVARTHRLEFILTVVSEICIVHTLRITVTRDDSVYKRAIDSIEREPRASPGEETRICIGPRAFEKPAIRARGRRTIDARSIHYPRARTET